MGGPQFTDDDLDVACTMVVDQTGDPRDMHVSPSGWYSHSVLAEAVQNTVPARWQFELNRFPSSGHDKMRDDAQIVGALMSRGGGSHWTAIVKHDGALWDVDSFGSAVPLSTDTFQRLVAENPDTCALMVSEFGG